MDQSYALKKSVISASKFKCLLSVCVVYKDHNGSKTFLKKPNYPNYMADRWQQFAWSNFMSGHSLLEIY